MSRRSDPEHLFEAVRSRHRMLRITGLIATAVGLGLAVWVGYRWFVWHTGHEVIAFAAAVVLLIGVQLLIFSALTSMMVALNREVIHRTRNP